jgi:hypothetical protein
MFLAMGWAQALDSVSPACLANALVRFGVPMTIVNVIRAIYTDRKFFVADSFSDSELHPQAFGISQGCPLSPFLFVMMMSVLMWDAKQDLQDIHGIRLDSDFVCHEVVYADDTLLIDVFGENLQKYMQCVAAQGKLYGLSLNFSKVECMPVNCESSLVDPTGNLIQTKSKLKYLGAHLASDGTITSELAQKLGQAECEFKALRQVWAHSNISRRFKYQIYVACVVQKLLYGLESAWINAAGKRKLDGFHARCLRRIVNFAPAVEFQMHSCCNNLPLFH